MKAKDKKQDDQREPFLMERHWACNHFSLLGEKKLAKECYEVKTINELNLLKVKCGN